MPSAASHGGRTMRTGSLCVVVHDVRDELVVRWMLAAEPRREVRQSLGDECVEVVVAPADLTDVVHDAADVEVHRAAYVGNFHLHALRAVSCCHSRLATTTTVCLSFHMVLHALRWADATKGWGRTRTLPHVRTELSKGPGGGCDNWSTLSGILDSLACVMMDTSLTM